MVTSDYIEQRIILQMGGARITPTELWWEIETLKKRLRKSRMLAIKIKPLHLLMS
ncbi:NYN domain-containing protein [Caloramator sp. mosi_1]|nr:NYN domain-containing protein [Caloramator sp. mosi_1]WDC83127.1 NYN domain-containing protein [Caloramator sp. mosi_1]